jgi:hypothetical protein
MEHTFQDLVQNPSHNDIVLSKFNLIIFTHCKSPLNCCIPIYFFASQMV